MNKLLKVGAISALGLMGILLATPGPDHKIDWCHFPPGQWTGNPATSKVLILSIDVAAEVGHLNHQGDGPLSVLGPACGGAQVCDNTYLGQLVYLNAFDTTQGTVTLVDLVAVGGPFDGTHICVCPNKTQLAPSVNNPNGGTLNGNSVDATGVARLPTPGGIGFNTSCGGAG